jgi:type II secretory pathway component PulC
MHLERIRTLLLTEERGVHLGVACLCLLGLASVLALSLMVSAWWGDLRLGAAQPQQLAEARSQGALELVIPQAHLFGSAQSEHVPITNSELHLTGVIKIGADESDNTASKAIIAMSGGVGKIYQVGDALSDGIRITDITADGVLIDNEGHSERLPLQRPKLGFKSNDA